MLKVSLLSSAAFLSFYTVCQKSEIFRGNVLFRLGRTTFTVSSMIVDYKLFYYNYTEKNSEYNKKFSEVNQKAARKLLDLTISNGGCFIKIGQHLGSLTYLLPPEYIDTLKVLHDDVPRESFNNIYKLIKEELQIEPSSVFSEIRPIPIGTASLAQVHYGKLLNSEQEVAIKVQHKEVRNHSQLDLACMDILFSLASKIFPQMNLQWLAEETRKNLPRELNFILEGKNAEDLSNRLSNKLPFLKIPKIFWNLSTEKLLIMEYYNGCKVTNKQYIQSQHFSTKEISRNLNTLYCEMIFNEGFVHCDPHPGNILISPTLLNSKGGILSRMKAYFWPETTRPCDIVLLDHGLYQKLSEYFLDHYSHLWLHMISGNEEGIKKEGDALGCKENLHKLLACMVSGRSWKAVSVGVGVADFTHAEAQYIRSNAGVFLGDMIDVFNSIPREMLLILKTNDLLRGIEHTLMGTPYNKVTMGLATMTRYCLRTVYTLDMQRVMLNGNSLTKCINLILETSKLYVSLFRTFCSSLLLLG